MAVVMHGSVNNIKFHSPFRSDTAAIYSGGSSQKQNVMDKTIANDLLVDNGGASEKLCIYFRNIVTEIT